MFHPPLSTSSKPGANATTLTSLAILKVRLDAKGDYLQQFEPFVRHVLCTRKVELVTDASVAQDLEQVFGLTIPPRTIQLVLKRITRDGGLVRNGGVYHLMGDFSATNLEPAKAQAQRHIQALTQGLMKFADESGHPFDGEESAVGAMCEFLAEFGIDSLRAILRGTTIPELKNEKSKSSRYLVGKYICEVQKSSPERFESFSILVQGHMLANALVCPDLVNAPKSFEQVTFYLDTPLLVQALGLEGKPRADATNELFRLLRVLGGKLSLFSHVREELESVVRGAADFVDDPKGRSRIVMEARRNRTTRSDLLLVAADLDDALAERGISVVSTPDYQHAQQIDEAAFSDVLTDELSYNNERARQYDINSIRSIYVLRQGKSPSTLERAGAVFVTTNAALAKAAYIYGREHESTKAVSSTISDFSLANVAWLKAPMESPTLPTVELLAFAYAATRPSEKLLDSFLREAERLAERGSISARHLQMLRGNLQAQDELMQLTLGEDEALSAETITQTLSRVEQEMVREERQRLDAERLAHEATRSRLEGASQDLERISRSAWERTVTRGKAVAWSVSAALVILIVIGIAVGLGATGAALWLRVIFWAGAGVVALLTLANLGVGATVRGLHHSIDHKARGWFWQRECKALGGNLPKPEANEDQYETPQLVTSTRLQLPGGEE